MREYPGPTGNLKAKHRRSGRAGTVWMGGNMLGEVVGIEWNVEFEQVNVPLPGQYQDGKKPGAEARGGTFRMQDVDDRWRRMVWGWSQARRQGNRQLAAQFPEFNIVTQIDDIGSPYASRWGLIGCSLFGYSGGHGQDEQILNRDIQFTFEDDGPIDTFVYTGAGGLAQQYRN